MCLWSVAGPRQWRACNFHARPTNPSERTGLGVTRERGELLSPFPEQHPFPATDGDTPDRERLESRLNTGRRRALRMVYQVVDAALHGRVRLRLGLGVAMQGAVQVAGRSLHTAAPPHHLQGHATSQTPPCVLYATGFPSRRLPHEPGVSSFVSTQPVNFSGTGLLTARSDVCGVSATRLCATSGPVLLPSVTGERRCSGTATGPFGVTPNPDCYWSDVSWSGRGHTGRASRILAVGVGGSTRRWALTWSRIGDPALIASQRGISPNG